MFPTWKHMFIRGLCLPLLSPDVAELSRMHATSTLQFPVFLSHFEFPWDREQTQGEGGGAEGEGGGAHREGEREVRGVCSDSVVLQ